MNIRTGLVKVSYIFLVLAAICSGGKPEVLGFWEGVCVIGMMGFMNLAFAWLPDKDWFLKYGVYLMNFFAGGLGWAIYLSYPKADAVLMTGLANVGFTYFWLMANLIARGR